MLAIKRLKDLKRRDRHHRNVASSHGYHDNGSDAGSVSPHSSVDGYPIPPPSMLAIGGDRRPSPMQSPSPNETLMMMKQRTGLRSSQESLNSDISNKSTGSLGSKGSKSSSTRGDGYGAGGPRQIIHQASIDHSEASYVPRVTSLKVSPNDHPTSPMSSPGTPSQEQQQVSSPKENMSFSTFKKPPPGHKPSVPTPPVKPKPPVGQLGDSPTAHPGQYNTNSFYQQDNHKLPSQKSSESLDKLLEECASHNIQLQQKRNSIEGGSSISSSGSGDLNMKLQRPRPPPPPKRSNSVITTKSDMEHVKTATIGRKKSMKQFREEMKVVRKEMQAAMAAAPPQAPNARSEIPDGYATIKRSPSRKASQQYQRTNDEANGVPRRPNSGGSIPTGQDLSPNELDQLRQTATRPLNLGSFSPPNGNSGRNTPNTPTPVNHTPGDKPVVASKPSGVSLNLAASHHLPPRHSNSRQASPSPQVTPKQHKEPPSLPSPLIIHEQQQQATISSPSAMSPHHPTSPNPQQHSYVAQRQDIPPSAGAFKIPDIPPAKVPQSSGNQFDRIEASLRQSMKSRTPTFPSTSDTASISSGSTSVSNGSSDSGLPRTKTERPSSVEMILKRSSGGEDAAAANPLEGIWRPRSRHFPTQSSVDEPDEASEEDGKPVQANVTFRALKQQFLEDEKAPKGLISGRRPSRKSEEFPPPRRSFTDADEHRQSPVCKNAPVSFDDLINDLQINAETSEPIPEDLPDRPPPRPPAALPKTPSKPPVALPSHARTGATPKTDRHEERPSYGNDTNYDSHQLHQDLPPPPSVCDLPPPPPPQGFPPPIPQDLPLPPPPMASYSPPSHSDAPLPPPPPPLDMASPQSCHQSMPPAPKMEASSPSSFIPLEPPRLPNMSHLPPPPPVPPATYKKSPSKSKTPPQAPPKKKTHKQPVVSEGWDSSDTIKRKPVLTTPPAVTHPKPELKLPVRPKPKATKHKTLPYRRKPMAPQSSEDVDIYSQDLDMMDSMVDDVVDSDSSDNTEVSGFENENTDTIKKQPMRLSPTKTKEEEEVDSVEAQLAALKMSMEMGDGGAYGYGDKGYAATTDTIDSLGDGKNVIKMLLCNKMF